LKWHSHSWLCAFPAEVSALSGLVGNHRSGTLICCVTRQSFRLPGKAGVRQLQTLDWGIVDHSPRGHIVLAAWDRKGNSAYVAPGNSVNSP
jgi:hypothetical protein